jgi:hypothetical protein
MADTDMGGRTHMAARFMGIHIGLIIGPTCLRTISLIRRSVSDMDIHIHIRTDIRILVHTRRDGASTSASERCSSRILIPIFRFNLPIITSNNAVSS